MKRTLGAAILFFSAAAAGCDLTNLVISETPCARPPYRLPEGIAEREPPPPPGGKEPVAPKCVSMTGAAPASFAEVQSILRGSCGAAGVCHLAGDQSEAGLDYAAVDLRAELVDRSASGAGRCRKEDRVEKRVVPHRPEESMLYRVVSGNDCGAHMPLGGAYLTCGDQQIIYGWIAGGAQPAADAGVAAR
jgi:hypothetical protein